MIRKQMTKMKLFMQIQQSHLSFARACLPLKILTKEKNRLHTSIFHTHCPINGHCCRMIIDGGSCENVVAQEVINKLQIPIEKHPTPYRLSWFKNGNEVTISTRALISFSIGGKYHDNVWCDVVPWMHAIYFWGGHGDLIEMPYTTAEKILSPFGRTI